MKQPPPPLEWHPYYRDKTWLFDWLNEEGPYAKEPRVLVPSKMYDLSPFTDTGSVRESITIIELNRKTASGLAPYVGRPFVYLWNCAIDRLDRAIAGESRIFYI